MSNRIRACIDLDEDTAALLDSLGDTRADILNRALYEYLTNASVHDLVNDLEQDPPAPAGIEHVTVRSDPAEVPSDATVVAETYHRIGYLDALNDLQAGLQEPIDNTEADNATVQVAPTPSED